MKKLGIGLSLALLSTLSVQAADSLEEAFANAKTSGQIRTFYITRDRSGTVGDTQTDRSAFAGGGHLKIETAPMDGLSFGAAFYTTHSLGFDDDTQDKVNATLYGEDKKGYSILGEAYLKYATGNTSLTIGRQKLATPLAGADDARMLPSLFEAAVLANTDVKDTTLIAAHITKFQAGTFSNAYGSNALAIHSGYGLNNISGTFMNAGNYAVGKDTDGVSAVAAIYKGLPNTTLQIWDYYAHDILNAIYGQADVKWNCLISDSVKPFAAAQIISQSDVGDKLAGDVDSLYYGVKAGAKIGAFGAYAAYSQTDSDTASAVNGGVISPWGGMPAFTQGMVTRHMFFADTSAFKVAGSYNFKEMGVNLNTALYYASFDVGADNAVKNGVDWEAEEFGFDFKYYPAAVKNLQLRLRGNFPTDFVEGLDWSEYRFIVNYNF
ncbi:MAG: OprD family porin [Epsilonproteobacteria bacterium]|nr:OprD family porin [Campylobacterota bacterium]